MYMFLAAALLIIGDPDDTHNVDPTWFHNVGWAMQELAVEWEILDDRERRYMLVRYEDFHSDLALLRRRYQELKDAPSIHDSLRFPERPVINEYLAFNRQYRSYLDNTRPNDSWGAEKFARVIRETDNLYHTWDIVRDARCEYYYISVRRQALKNLRERIGYDDYYSGKLPPWVPVWRFQEIR